jgi:MFS family permease
VIVALLAAEFISAFELTMVIAALKYIILEFGSPVGAGWMITSYLLVSAAAAALCGRLGDLFGRRRVLLIVLVLATVGSLISLLSETLWVVIVGRSIQGFAGAILPLCYGLVRENLPEERVPFGVAIIAYSVLIASSMGFLVGGMIVDHVGWRYIFLASAAMAIVAIAMCVLLVPPSRQQPRSGSIDILGGVLFVPALTAILLGTSSIGSAGLWAPQSSLSLSGGVLLLAIWIWHELRIPNPLIDLRIMARRNTALAIIAMSCYGLGPFQSQVVQLLAQQSSATGIGLGLSATQASLLNIPSQIVALLITPIAAVACARFGARLTLIVASALMVAQAALLILFHYSMFSLVSIFAVATLGTICLFASAPNLIVADVPADQISGATGMMQVSRSVMAAIGSQIVAALLATELVSDPVTGKGPFPASSAYMVAFFFIALAATIMLAASLFVHGGAKSVRRAVPRKAAMDSGGHAV